MESYRALSLGEDSPTAFSSELMIFGTAGRSPSTNNHGAFADIYLTIVTVVSCPLLERCVIGMARGSQ
jgi:hypothetical protein